MKTVTQLREKLRSVFSIENDYRKLKSAVEEGRIAPYCGLTRYYDEVCRILGAGEHAAIILYLMLEEAEREGIRMKTVGDLLRFMAAQAGRSQDDWRKEW